MIGRREFVISAVALSFSSTVSRTQPMTRALKIGALINGGPGPVIEINGRPSDVVELLRSEFARLGYAEGPGFALEPRYARGQLDRLPALAADLTQLGVDLILTLGGPASRSAKQATSTIPIVFSIVTDPVLLGLVASWERPGGNVTGVTSLDPEQADRQMALLRSVFPKLVRVGILSDDTIPGADASGLAPIDRANAAAARKLGIEPIVRKVAGSPTPPDYAAALDDMRKNAAEALVVLEVPMPLRDGKIVAKAAAARRIPTVFPGGQSGTGGLISYGTSVPNTWPRIVVLADKILKGAKPGELPVETESRREFVVNMKTARAIGLTIPDEVLKRADRIID